MSDAPPEHNVTGHDYSQRGHFRHVGPLIDFHAHVTITRPSDPANGPALGTGPGASLAQAETMLGVAREFGVEATLTMCLPDDIPPLRERFGDRLLFNGPIQKRSASDPDDDAYRLLDRYLSLGVRAIKFWAAPRGRERGLFVDAPWRIEAAKRARAAGVRLVMVHVADPDTWFRNQYADASKFGTKDEQYVGLRRLLEGFPDLTFVGAHMGGWPERPEFLDAMLERYPNLRFDTSATKWIVREVSPRREAIRALIERWPGRFLFGSDLVTRHHLTREHYVSRYWCQRTLWESEWTGPSPITDPDHAGPGPTPTLAGVSLGEEILKRFCLGNARALLGLSGAAGGR